MRVAWLNEAPIVKDATGKITGGLASVRYRCLIPQAELKSKGVESILLGSIDRADDAAFAQAMDKVRPDVAVIGKVFSPRIVEHAAALNRRGIKLIADFCDNHFAKPDTGPIHRALIEAADTVVAATPMMAEAIKTATGRDSALIPDPYEGPFGAPRFTPKDRLKLLWFGGRTNIDTIAPALPSLDKLGETQPLALTIFTDSDPKLDRLIEQARSLYRNIAINFVPWSLEGQWKAIAECDAVIIPSLDNETKNVKGPNRLIEAIHGGRPVAAYPLPSYLPFADVTWLDADVANGLRKMLAAPDQVAAKVEAGQALVEARHAPQAIAELWRGAFTDLTSERASTMAAPHVTTAMENDVSDTTRPEGPPWDYFSWFYARNIWKNMHYRGIRTLKYPPDMWNYQEIITERGIDYIVETGSRHGGSALFFSDLLTNLKRDQGRVITIDPYPEWQYDPKPITNIIAVAKDSGDPAVAAEVHGMIPESRKGVFLILDSDHSAKHVLRELNAHVPHLRKGDYVIVEDTVVNGHPVRLEHGPGPWEGIMEYLRANPGKLLPDNKRALKFGSTAAIDGFYIVA
jgi:cephalosporin hydroxylase